MAAFIEGAKVVLWFLSYKLWDLILFEPIAKIYEILIYPHLIIPLINILSRFNLWLKEIISSTLTGEIFWLIGYPLIGAFIIYNLYKYGDYMDREDKIGSLEKEYDLKLENITKKEEIIKKKKKRIEREKVSYKNMIRTKMEDKYRRNYRKKIKELTGETVEEIENKHIKERNNSSVEDQFNF